MGAALAWTYSRLAAPRGITWLRSSTDCHAHIAARIRVESGPRCDPKMNWMRLFPDDYQQASKLDAHSRPAVAPDATTPGPDADYLAPPDGRPQVPADGNDQVLPGRGSGPSAGG